MNCFILCFYVCRGAVVVYVVSIVVVHFYVYALVVVCLCVYNCKKNGIS